MRPLLLAAAGAIVALTACAPSERAAPQSADARQPSSRAGGTLKLAWDLEPGILAPKFTTLSGGGEYHWLFSSPLTYLDLGGVPHPMLAQEIPTQANGGWVVNPDGTMVTTYRLRPNNRWHDGTPLTAADFVFAREVYVDPEVVVTEPSPEVLMERVEAPDDYTVVIRWKEPYANANTLGFEQLIPLPRHVLEAKYRTNKANFIVGPEWTTAYISTGPFKVERWTPGVGMLATAHMDFALGPPKLDAIDIRFISDINTQVANLLSGEIDMINSPGVRAKEAAIARDQWAATGEGYVKNWSTGATFVEWQLRDVANWQRAMSDSRVRQALIHAIDREAINDTVNLGFVSVVAHTFISPQDPLFPETDRVISKYAYDVNRAATLLAEAGWRRPVVGGGPASNAAGQPLDVEVFTTASQEQQATIVADNWKEAGANASLFVVPPARSRDGELGSNFSGVRMNFRNFGPADFAWRGDNLPTAENRWTGSNRGSFVDAEVDRLHTLRVTSLDENQRRQATIAVMKRMSEVVGPTPLIYAVDVVVARKFISGPEAKVASQGGMTWNVHEWEIIR